MDLPLAGSLPPALLVILLGYSAWALLFKRRESPAMHTVAILVLGDIGRSPRMMYHAESFAKNNFETYLVGYRGSRPVPSLLSLPHVRFLYLTETPTVIIKLPFLLLAPLKVLLQVTTILTTLLFRIAHPPAYILVQNPPSIPTLALTWLVCKVRGSKLIIDWHNLGYSILALRLGSNHLLVKIARKFEATFGRVAYAHLFVTKAMHDHLIKEWNLQGITIVLHDRPPAHFHRASAFETHDLLLRLRTSFSSPTLMPFLPPSSPPRSTPFTHLATTPAPSHQTTSRSLISDSIPFTFNSRLPSLRPDRPALVVSSTSWTPDEDFDILLQALRQYEKRATAANLKHGDNEDEPPILPKMLVIVTGKGPLKERYMKKVSILEEEEAWRWVRCRSLWLEAEDYPLLIGSADLGVCLHASSSALDLPMKIVDMFGCGLPVCALSFACLPELVKENRNGLIFRSASQLAEQLEDLLTDFPRDSKLIALRQCLLRTSKSTGPDSGTEILGEGNIGREMHWEWNTWEENWNKIVRPLILGDMDR